MTLVVFVILCKICRGFILPSVAAKQKVPLAGTAGKAKKEPGSSHCPAYAN
jgi:hypothetical protein